MTVVADLGIDVEVVEHAELARQCVCVRRHVVAEQAQRRIGVAAIEIAEHLIEGTVLADDVEHVLDRRGIADAARDGRTHRRVGRCEPVLVGIGHHAARHHGQLLQRRPIRIGNKRKRAHQHRADVLPLAAGDRPRHRAGIGRRGQTLAAEDEDLAAVAADHRTGRVPPGRNEPFDLAATRRRDVDDGDRVVVGVRHQQPLLVGREADGVRCRSRRRVRIHRHGDLLAGLSSLDVNGPDRIGVGAGDKQPAAVFCDREGIGMFADGNVAARLERLDVEQQHLRAAPQRHEQRFAVGRHQAGVRLGGQIDRAQHVAGPHVDHAEDLAEDVHREEARAVGGDGEAADETLWNRLGTIRSLRGCFHRSSEHEIRPARQAGFFRPGRGLVGIASARSAFVQPQLVDGVIAGARHVEPLPVRMPRQAEPGVIEHDHVADALRFDVDDGDRRLHVSVRGDVQRAAVGRFHHGQRQTADLQVPAGRRDLPPVGEQGDAAAQRPWPQRCRDVAVRGSERGRECDQHERQTGGPTARIGRRGVESPA